MKYKLELIKKFLEGDKDYIVSTGYQSGLGKRGINTLIIAWNEDEV